MLGHDQTMMHLLQTLAACNSSTMAMILASSGAINSANTFYITEPLSVGDCVFKILSCLNKKTTDINLILRPLHDYISCSIMGNMCNLRHIRKYLAHKAIILDYNAFVVSRLDHCNSLYRSLFKSSINKL